MYEGWLTNFVAQNRPLRIGVLYRRYYEDTIRYYVVDKIRTQEKTRTCGYEPCELNENEMAII